MRGEGCGGTYGVGEGGGDVARVVGVAEGDLVPALARPLLQTVREEEVGGVEGSWGVCIAAAGCHEIEL